MNTPRGYIHTYTGLHFKAHDPSPDQICIEDIAHALSLTCRFGGHCDKMYSVAHHSVLLSYMVPKTDALAALLHDAAEAYLGDMPKPIKNILPDYVKLEKTVSKIILEKFGLQPHLPLTVHCQDNRILTDEAKSLFHIEVDWVKDKNGTLNTKDNSTDIKPWPSLVSEIAFLKRFIMLTKGTAFNNVTIPSYN